MCGFLHLLVLLVTSSQTYKYRLRYTVHNFRTPNSFLRYCYRFQRNLTRILGRLIRLSWKWQQRPQQQPQQQPQYTDALQTHRRCTTDAPQTQAITTTTIYHTVDSWSTTDNNNHYQLTANVPQAIALQTTTTVQAYYRCT